MTDVDKSCPVCGSTERQLHHNPLAWECTACGTVYQDILETDADGNVVERSGTNVLERGSEE